MDMWAITRNIFAPVISFIQGLVLLALSVVLVSILIFLLLFFVICRVNPAKMTAHQLEHLTVKFKPYDLMRWILWDIITRKERVKRFDRYGFSIFCGRQGAGKTISMVEYLQEAKRKYPNVIIVANFECSVADHMMTDWRQLMEIRNGTDGVIFAIDEIHSEYSAESWKDFPESLLSEISQQRKQAVKIVATAQVYSRVAKPIREQCFSVIMCYTFLGRLTVTKEYDAAEYSTSDTPYQVKRKCKPISRHCFVQSNKLRDSYDTYQKIERMRKLDYIPRHERH